jgi:nitroreductase
MTKNEQIEHSLSWRYAVKRFDSGKKISDRDWKTLEASLVMAPSSYGLQPWKFIIVQNPELREKLKVVSWNQAQVTEASHLVVIAAKEHILEEDVHKYMARTSEIRGIALESLKGFREMLLSNVVNGMNRDSMLAWNQRQTYIAMGFLLQSAALLGIDSTPMEGLDATEYDRILNLTGSGFKTVAAVALGYRHDEDHSQKSKKVRYHENDLIEFRK